MVVQYVGPYGEEYQTEQEWLDAWDRVRQKRYEDARKRQEEEQRRRDPLRDPGSNTNLLGPGPQPGETPEQYLRRLRRERENPSLNPPVVPPSPPVNPPVNPPPEEPYEPGPPQPYHPPPPPPPEQPHRPPPGPPVNPPSPPENPSIVVNPPGDGPRPGESPEDFLRRKRREREEPTVNPPRPVPSEPVTPVTPWHFGEADEYTRTLLGPHPFTADNPQQRMMQTRMQIDQFMGGAPPSIQRQMDVAQAQGRPRLSTALDYMIQSINRSRNYQ